MITFVTQYQASQLLYNKFVVILGGSVERSMYKDLVVLLQKDRDLTLDQLRTKGEASFECDRLVEGGSLGVQHNGTAYREVRQYRSPHHLVRFYFLTRVYSPYMESILEDLRTGLQPDLLIVNSCIWDISRYRPNWFPDYHENLHKFFERLMAATQFDCLRLWVLTLPLGRKIKGGFLVPEISHLGATMEFRVLEANFCSSQLAAAYGLDVLDLHFHFRFSQRHRMLDGVHWDAWAHRRATALMLHHAADAWGVRMNPPPGPCFLPPGPRFLPPGPRFLPPPAWRWCSDFPRNNRPPFHWNQFPPIRPHLPPHNMAPGFGLNGMRWHPGHLRPHYGHPGSGFGQNGMRWHPGHLRPHYGHPSSGFGLNGMRWHPGHLRPHYGHPGSGRGHRCPEFRRHQAPMRWARVHPYHHAPWQAGRPVF